MAASTFFVYRFATSGHRGSEGLSRTFRLLRCAAARRRCSWPPRSRRFPWGSCGWGRLLWAHRSGSGSAWFWWDAWSSIGGRCFLGCFWRPWSLVAETKQWVITGIDKLKPSSPPWVPSHAEFFAPNAGFLWPVSLSRRGTSLSARPKALQGNSSCKEIQLKSLLIFIFH